jgi:hypothetical protein
MSINPVSGFQPTTSVAAAAASIPSSVTVTAVVMSTEPVIVDTIPATPPPDVLAAVQTASQSYDQLAATGHQVHFASDPQNGRLSIQVLDMAGAHVSTITPTKTLEIASGSQQAIKDVVSAAKSGSSTTGRTQR